ncbi:MAG: hypothetical protein V1778_05080 [bacterium]
MSVVRKLASTRRGRARRGPRGGVDRTYVLNCRMLGYNRNSLQQTLVYADGMVVRTIQVPTALLARAGIRGGCPNVNVRVTEYVNGGMLLQFEAAPRVPDDELPQPVRTIIKREGDFS